jgi:hypothetical protein
MTGGLLQIISSGKQDVFLTFKPEITFFKRIYRHHTNFSIELIEILSEQQIDYNNIISFIINIGDAIYRCYLEIELPVLNFTDNYITNSIYNEKKQYDINNLMKLYNITNANYTNLKNYVDIEMELYRNLYNSLQIDNITINYLKDMVYNFNYEKKSLKDIYISQLDSFIYTQINMSNYILSLDKFLVNDTIISNTNSISKNTILNKLDEIYNSMIYYLNQYNNTLNETNKKINDINETKIDFNYSQFLGHVFFEYFTLEIGGQEIIKYSNDVLHINQLHKIKEEFMSNYLEMIGHTSDLNEFNNKSKGNNKILVPLIFWFNKDPGSCLPLVALQYSTVTINAKINDIKKIICFENYEKHFIDILNVSLLFKSEKNIEINSKFIYLNYKIDYTTKYIKYECLYINDELLKYKFPDLSSNEITYILQNNGIQYTSKEILLKCKYPYLTDGNIKSIIIDNNSEFINEINKLEYKNYSTQFLITKLQWIKLMLNLNNSSYNYNKFYYKFASYYPYIDFNLYYSTINSPTIKLIGEIIYFDNMEREKFADYKLEYVIETYDENIFNINNQNNFDCELSFNNPCKELLWYIQPQLFLDGLTEFGQNISLIFNSNNYFNNNIILDQKLIFNQIDSLIKNVDSNYYTNLLSYKYLNNILPEGIYYKSFCLYPEESQPSGTINLRYFKGKQYYCSLNQKFLDEYTSLLNLLYSNIQIANKNIFILKFISKNYELITIHKGRLIVLFES